MKLIAIDPGVSGAIAISDGTLLSTKTFKMPTDVKSMIVFFEQHTNCICIIEKLHMRPSDMFGGRAFRISKMLAQFEQLKASLTSCNINFIEVMPAHWQKSLNLTLKGKKEEYSDRKRRLKAAAAKRFPNTKVTLKNSDALLIMYFLINKIEFDKCWIEEKTKDHSLDTLF